MQLALQRGDEGRDRRDHRVEAVLEVLGGARTAHVAARRGIEQVLLKRWVRAFVDGGTELVTNQPREDAARSRDRFLAAFAHELRTPLAVAQGWSALLEDPEVEAEELELATPGSPRRCAVCRSASSTSSSSRPPPWGASASIRAGSPPRSW